MKMQEDIRMGDYVLISLRDPGLPTYTWFWVKDEQPIRKTENGSSKIISPYFNTREDAMVWADNNPEWSIE